MSLWSHEYSCAGFSHVRGLWNGLVGEGVDVELDTPHQGTEVRSRNLP